jgi:bacillolysin
MLAKNKFTQLFLSVVVVLTMTISTFRLPSVYAQGTGGIKRQINPQTGKLSFIGPENGHSLSASQALGITSFARPADLALALAERFGPEFGLKNPERDLSQMKIHDAENGRKSVRYQQYYQGIPVMGGELIVNTDENGDLYSMNGEVSTDLSLFTQPTIDPEQARQSALRAVAKWYQKTTEDFVASEPELWIYDESLLRSSTRPAELVWRMEVTPKDKGMPVRELVLVNTQRGSLSLHFNEIDTAWQSHRNSSSFDSNPLDPKVAVDENLLLVPTLSVKTYTANSGPTLPGTLLCNQTDPNCTAGDLHAKAAHKYAIGTFNLYATQFGRNSIDNNGMTITSTVHYCESIILCPFGNAFWSGTQMVYGDAYGFPLADDVVAHELTHGVTQYESSLFYYYQSGAINESFSDLWGEYYDQTNGLGTDTAGVKWQIGEDISDLGTIRNMSDPAAFGDPDKMSSANYDESEEDNGGVHHNSGVNSKAVFLMVDGGSFNGKTVTALGWTKVVAIYYEVNTNLLSSGADYSDLYYALQQACSNLIGQKGITSGNCTEVKDALDAVEMNGQPAPNFNTDAPYCDGDSSILTTFSDDLESGTGNWTFNNGAYPRWQIDSPDGPFAQSGLHSLYADDKPDLITDVNARLKSIVVPNNAYLHFAQAYGFESGFNFFDLNFYDYDGGVLEYSINNGSSWVDAGSLIDFNGYTGTIFTGAGNPLSGRSAFVGSSHGYISTRLNLTSLAGKTVSFRWRMGLDEATSAWGWWVDNISVYTCNIILQPGAFNKTSPGNGDTGVGLSTTLSWGSSSSADYYQYCYDIIRDNQCNRTWSGPLTATSAVISNLGTNTTYYWQVRAVNAQGTTDANNHTWGSFTTTSTLPAGTAGIETFVSTTKQGKYSLENGQSLRESYTDVNNGPVKIVSTNSIPLISAERVIYRVNNISASFSEMMALADGQLDKIYWLPWYNNVDLDTQLRFGNVSNTPAEVHVWIGGEEKTSGCTTTPSNVPYPYILAAGASLRVSCPGVNNGPVKIVSNVNIVAAERVIYNVNNLPTSFTEMMGLPNSQLDNTYWMPWYNNVDLDTQLRFGNVSNSPAEVHVWIGTQEMTTGCTSTPSNVPYPYVLAVGASLRVSCPGVNNGPVKIVSNVNIVAAERVIYKVNNLPTSFTEMMGLPNAQLDNTYWMPWYNNVDLDTQLRFGNVSNSPATVRMWIGGQEKTSGCTSTPSNVPYPYVLAAGESLRVSCLGLNSGPVQIVSNVNIVAAERVIYNVNNLPTSFSEMMALPNSHLDNTYWMPWYNNVDLDTQLRFGVP